MVVLAAPCDSSPTASAADPLDAGQYQHHLRRAGMLPHTQGVLRWSTLSYLTTRVLEP